MPTIEQALDTLSTAVTDLVLDLQQKAEATDRQDEATKNVFDN